MDTRLLKRSNYQEPTTLIATTNIPTSLLPSANLRPPDQGPRCLRAKQQYRLRSFTERVWVSLDVAQRCSGLVPQDGPHWLYTARCRQWSLDVMKGGKVGGGVGGWDIQAGRNSWGRVRSQQ